MIKILLTHQYLIQSDKKEILLQHYVKFLVVFFPRFHFTTHSLSLSSTCFLVSFTLSNSVII